MKFIWAGGTHVGRVRPNNEDAFYPEHDGGASDRLLAAVADGMGGHTGGEVASRTAVACAVNTEGSPRDRIEAANQAVMTAVLDAPDLAGMGTTFTLAQLDPGGRLTLGHVGDSRAYLLRGGRLDQLTTDDNMAQELVEGGEITKEEARGHPHSSWLTQALGFEDNLDVEVRLVDLEAGDRLMLCSDGLHGMLPDGEIGRLLGKGTPSDAVWGLIEAANLAGGRDNITVMVVDAAEGTRAPEGEGEEAA